MPQDTTAIDAYLQNAASTTTNKELLKDLNASGYTPTAPTSVGKNTNVQKPTLKGFNDYGQNPAFLNNVSIMLGQANNQDGTPAQWDVRFKNILDGKFDTKLQEIYETQGKKVGQNIQAWRDLDSSTREFANLMSRMTIEKNKDGQPTITNTTLSEAEYERFVELSSTWSEKFVTATRALQFYTDKDGKEQMYSKDRRKYTYDWEKNDFTTQEMYDQEHSDIYTTDLFADRKEGFSEFGTGPFTAFLKQMGHTSQSAKQGINTLMDTWTANLWNGTRDASAFKSNTDYVANKYFALDYTKELMSKAKHYANLGSLGNYSTKDIQNLETKLNSVYDSYYVRDKNKYSKSTSDPIVKYFKDNQSKLKEIQDLLGYKGKAALYKFFESHEAASGRIAPGVSGFKNDPNKAEEWDEYINRTKDFIRDEEELKGMFGRLGFQAIQDMRTDGYFDFNKRVAIDSGNSNTNRGVKAKDLPWYEDLWEGVKYAGRFAKDAYDVSFGNPMNAGDAEAEWSKAYGLNSNKYLAKWRGETQKAIANTLFNPTTNNMYNADQLHELWFNPKNKADAQNAYMLNKQRELGVDEESGEYSGFLNLPIEEQSKKFQEWQSEFDNIYNSISTGRDISLTAFKKEYNDFYQGFASYFGRVKHAHAYKRASKIAGEQRYGNYALEQKYLTLTPHTNPETDSKNQNALKVFEGVDQALKNDEASKLFDANGNLKSSETRDSARNPNLLILPGAFKFDFNLQDGDWRTENFPDNVPTDKGIWIGTYNKDEQKAFYDNFFSKKGNDGQYYDITYFNNTAYGDYKGYQFTDRKTGEKMTIYLNSEIAQSTGEGFASAEYNDSSDAIFDTKGYYSVNHLSQYGGIDSKTGMPRISDLKLINKNGFKYLEYYEVNSLEDINAPVLKQKLLAPNMKLNVDDAVEQVKNLLMLYNDQLSTKQTKLQSDLSNRMF